MRSRRSRSLAVLTARPYWREAEAKTIVDALEASGLTLTEFCRRHGVRSERVSRWRSELRRSADRAAVDLVEVDVIASARAGRGVTQEASEVEVVLCNGRRVAVRQGFDAELLAEVAQVVESWRC